MPILYSDNFSTGGLLSAYDYDSYTAGLTSSSNAAYKITNDSTNALSIVKVAVANAEDNQWAQATLSTVASFDFGGIGVQLTTSGNGYIVYNDNGSSRYRLVRLAAGSETGLGDTYLTAVPTSGDTLYLEYLNNYVTLNIGGVQKLHVYDDTYATAGGQPGLFYRYENGGNTKITSFSCGDFSTGGDPTITLSDANDTDLLDSSDTPITTQSSIKWSYYASRDVTLLGTKVASGTTGSISSGDMVLTLTGASSSSGEQGLLLLQGTTGGGEYALLPVEVD